MPARTRIRIAVGTLTASALLGAGVALAGPAAADETPQPPALVAVPNLDEVMYEGPVNDLLMPVGDVLDVVDPTGVDEQEGESEALTAPAGEDDVAELDTAPPAKPAKKKAPGKR